MCVALEGFGQGRCEACGALDKLSLRASCGLKAEKEYLGNRGLLCVEGLRCVSLCAEVKFLILVDEKRGHG